MKKNKLFFMGLVVWVMGVCSVAAHAGFVHNGNGTVTDSSTGLIWQQDTARDGEGNCDTMTWQEALAYCEALNLGGHTDWRLPTIKELGSLVDLSRYLPSINTTYFPNTVLSFYWSSTTIARGMDHAWGVQFDDGADLVDSKSDSGYVRAVHEGEFIATVTTASPTNITSIAAVGGGTVTLEEGFTEVTARGLCWSTSSDPTISDSTVKCGSGTGSFSCNMTGLTQNTTYNVRAYATNSAGTGYGDAIPFVTEDAAADLSVEKSVADSNVDVGDSVTFAIAVLNQGPSDATGVEVTEQMPEGLSYLNDDSGGAYDPVTGIWEVPDLSDGKSATLRVTATAEEKGRITNTAVITASDQADPYPDNDSDTALIRVGWLAMPWIYYLLFEASENP